MAAMAAIEAHANRCWSFIRVFLVGWSLVIGHWSLVIGHWLEVPFTRSANDQ
jgi:hypothetical protein